jgi:hypothetical protein
VTFRGTKVTGRTQSFPLALARRLPQDNAVIHPSSKCTTLDDIFAVKPQSYFIFAGNTFFLIQTDVAPQLGDDLDANSDGFVDEGGIIANWNVLDSITTMWSLSDGHGYGAIVFVNTNEVHFPEITKKEGTTLVRVDGFGYVGRIGNSTGSTAEDWVGGTVKDLNNDQYRVRLASDIHGRPAPIVFQGRELDSVGSENFTGASRLQFFQDDNGNAEFDPGEQPLAGATGFLS